MSLLIETPQATGVALPPPSAEPSHGPPENAAAPRGQVNQLLIDMEVRYELQNDVSLVFPLTEEVQRLVASVYGEYDETFRFQLAISMEEALTNAIVHGNLEISSESRISSDTLYYDLITERTSKLPYCARRVRLNVSLGREQLVFEVRDEGPGFDVAAVPDPTADENLDKPCGRGLMLMRNFMDTVLHNELGNAVKMTKSPPQTSQT